MEDDEENGEGVEQSQNLREINEQLEARDKLLIA